MSLGSRRNLLLAGIAIGIGYGLLTRVVFGEQATMSSITYLFLVPAVLGAVPLMLARDEQLRSYRSIIFIPWLTFGGVFLAMGAFRLEGMICVLILGTPFFVAGTVGGFLYRMIRLRREGRRHAGIALLLLPFLLSPIEDAIRSPSREYRVTSEVLIAADAPRVWKNIIRVAAIDAAEYTPGLFHRLGIPRPIEAQLLEEGIGGHRIGHFEGGLRFDERITEWRPNRRVAFSITVAPGTVRQAAFDEHVLKGNYFRFIDAAYDIRPAGGGAHWLRLTSRYQLTSKLNFYGRFWGERILRDFQDRLLLVVQKRSEARRERVAALDGGGI